MKKMSLSILISLLIFIFLPGVFGQEMNLPLPETPEMELPPILQELIDRSDAQLEALIPELEVELPALEDIELPKPEPLAVDDSFPLFQVEVAEADSVSPPGETSWRSEGEIGFGSMNEVLGKVVIRSPGINNAFDFSFVYDRYDGYNFTLPGSGFSHRNVNLGGGFSTSFGSAYMSLQGLYGESSDGLQGQSSDFSEMTYRFFSGDVSLGIGVSNPEEFSVRLEGRGAEQILSGPAPESGWEISLAPSITANFNLDPLSLGVDLRYLLRGFPGFSSRQLHLLRPDLAFEVDFLTNFSIGGGVGLHWIIGGDYRIPFYLSWKGSFPNAWAFSVSGGYKVEENSYYQRWNSMPFINYSGENTFSSGWYVRGSAAFYPLKAVTLETALSVNIGTRTFGVSGGPDPRTGLIFLSPVAYTGITSDVSFQWIPKSGITVSAGWKGHFIEVPAFTPAHSIIFGLETGGNKSPLKGFLQLENRIAETIIVPFLTMRGSAAVSKNVTFAIQGDDLLSPFIEGGREYWNGFKAPGLRVIVSTRISL